MTFLKQPKKPPVSRRKRALARFEVKAYRQKKYGTFTPFSLLVTDDVDEAFNDAKATLTSFLKYNRKGRVQITWSMQS